ncbi:DNA polymerase I, partial [Peptococcaceae bacterium]|nr:DNA polymerase I [Peptococcaceae bacterium]
MSNKKKLIIIDGNSLIYRAFYAIPLLKTSANLVTNAAYGFTNMMLKVLKDEEPDFVIVVFDKSRTTFRTEQYSEYKANRKPVPDDLKHQFQIVRDILAAMNIQIFELENYEADDLIGTIAKSVANDIFVLIITGDRDILQLVSENINVLTTKKGISQLEIYDRDKVFEKFGVYPEQFVDFRAITGDTSDNIPGVPGIGAKTAAKLLQKYKNLDNILSHLNELSKKHKEKFLKYKDQLLLSKELASLKLDLPVNINLQDCACKNPNYER